MNLNILLFLLTVFATGCNNGAVSDEPRQVPVESGASSKPVHYVGKLGGPKFDEWLKVPNWEGLRLHGIDRDNLAVDVAFVVQGNAVLATICDPHVDFGRCEIFTAQLTDGNAFSIERSTKDERFASYNVTISAELKDGRIVGRAINAKGREAEFSAQAVSPGGRAGLYSCFSRGDDSKLKRFGLSIVNIDGTITNMRTGITENGAKVFSHPVSEFATVTSRSHLAGKLEDVPLEAFRQILGARKSRREGDSPVDVELVSGISFR